MRSSPNYHHPYTFVFVVILFPALAVSYKTLSATESLTISSNETIVSHNETFELGFFTPGSSSRWYLGIWYKKIPTRTYVWVANRDNPLSHPNGSLKISSDNNLVIYDHSSNTPVWSTNLTVGTLRSPLVAELLDNGNFVLRHSNNNEYLWQSFDFPTDTLLPDMKLGWDKKTGLDRVLRSWRGVEDPSSGDFSTKLETRGFPEYYVFNKERIIYRSGPWIGNRFSCIPEMKPVDYMVYTFIASNEEVTYSYQMTKPDVYSVLSVSYMGTLQRRNWIESAQIWKQLWYQPKDICDNYKQCGSYGYGDSNTIPSCNCIKGFERRNEQEWALRDDSAGCVRKTKLSCDGRDGFVVVKKMKLPDTTATVLDRGIGLKECEAKCLNDCNCTAYANTDIRDGGSGCVIWKGGLFDIRSYANGGQDLYVKLAATDLDHVRITSHGTIIGSGIGVTIFLLISIIILFGYWKRKQKSDITIQTPRGKSVTFIFFCICKFGKGFPEYYVFNKETIIYRSGPWIGNRFSCVPEMKPIEYMVYTFIASNEEVSYAYHMTKPDVYSTLSLSYTGTIQRRNWIEQAHDWKQLWYQPKDICDNYRQCGNYGYCDSNNLPNCNCIKGFGLENGQEWALRDDSAGCVRKTRLSCDGRDGFVAVKRMKLPDTAATVLDRGIGLKECKAKCLQDCNCTAYANTDIRDGGSGCVIWNGGLFDIRMYPNGGQDIYVKLAAADLDHVKITSHGTIIGSGIGLAILLLLSIIIFGYWKRKQKRFITIQTPIGFPEVYVCNKESIVYRSGPWDGIRFNGIPEVRPVDYLVLNFSATDKEITYSYHITKSNIYSILTLTPTGLLQRSTWVERLQSWRPLWYSPRDICNNYKQCGSYGYCDSNASPVCNCIHGFKPRNKWDLRDDFDGCVRKTRLSCDGTDGFVRLKNMKLPDTTKTIVDRGIGTEECEARCLKNCNCTAFANADIRNGGWGCVIWTGDMLDMRYFAEGGQDLYVRQAAADLDDKITNNGKIIGSSVGMSILFLLSIIIFRFWKTKQKRATAVQTPIVDQVRSKDSLTDEVIVTRKSYISRESKTEDLELPLMEFEAVAIATNNFSDGNKLGKGGFGIVYKGMLPDGKEIAVKRLSKKSLQGTGEFKNEVRLIARLQHLNLVRLLGCCVDKGEKMLIYEYLENLSLDSHLFDKIRRSNLSWQKRFDIANGIARGLLYLHQDSRFRVIHRDLKASNILLDKNMTPKISDFGMARIFGREETEANTRKVVGTYGYMSPEYAMDGIFSMKSDVFSFGVLLLEIISGKKTNGFYNSNRDLNLLGFVWRYWKEGKGIEIVDPIIIDDSSSAVLRTHEILRCIQIGLLCVQERAEDRPVMSTVMVMLGSETTAIPQPKRPGFCVGRSLLETESSSSTQRGDEVSVNQITLSVIDAR
ncbi:unnamed protein product [Brassica napus]|uniref:non-specific serine/threonine protein kinase n=1 Tax=Brassica napus TaxID=3708 RepID=A0A816ZBH4_BRANA|nr:unnamed protein product [Brassica napus]